MRFEEKLKRYADLAVRAGCNLQKGQDLYLTAPICAAEFARMTVKSAYEAGARQVIVQWTDEAVTRMGYEYSPLEVYEQYPEWMAKLRNGAAEQGAAMLFIDASNPGAMAGIDPRKPAASSRASNAACKPYRDAVNQGKVAWCIIAAAAPDWAAKVFPELPADAALEQLWDCIFQAVRVDQADPNEAWETHRHNFDARRALLNKYQFTSLHYKNAHGTDITIGLPKTDVVGKSVGVGFKPLLSLIDAPDPDTMFHEPLHYEGGLIRFAAQTVEHEHKQDVELALFSPILEKLEFVPVIGADLKAGYTVFLFLAYNDPAHLLSELPAGFTLHWDISLVLLIVIHLFCSGYSI